MTSSKLIRVLSPGEGQRREKQGHSYLFVNEHMNRADLC
jgi:hypothetical protein